MNNKQLLNEAEYLLKKNVDRGGCYATALLEATDNWAFNIDRGNVNAVV